MYIFFFAKRLVHSRSQPRVTTCANQNFIRNNCHSICVNIFFSFATSNIISPTSLRHTMYCRMCQYIYAYMYACVYIVAYL